MSARGVEDAANLRNSVAPALDTLR
eukprot:SAG11_NODE_29843_length_306_cov_1.251208_1_plen_24_part_01